jgi:CheY-like chemotaxis protein
MAMVHDFILVVDDDQAIRDTIVDVLEDAAYQVRVAKDGQEALDPRPCLVLLDLMMPGMSSEGAGASFTLSLPYGASA